MLWERGRARARLNSWYQIEQVAESMPPGYRHNAGDRAAFAMHNPEAGRQLESMFASQRISLASGVIGSVASGAHSFRRGGSALYGIVGAFLGGLVAASLADNVRLMHLWRCPVH